MLYVRIRKRNEFVCHAKIRLMKKLKRKEYKTNKWNITRNSKFWLVLSIGIIGILGVLILKYGTASTYSISLETENGLKSNIVDCQDSQASQGECVQFGKSTSLGESIFDQACSKQLNYTVSGTVSSASAGLDEISGVVVSRKQNDVYWVNEDSGDSARVIALNSKGAVIGRFTLTGSGVSAYDYEDLGMGPGPVDGQDYLYIADIGDNNAVRSTIKIYRIPEPNANINGGTKTVSADSITLKYPDGAHNAESYFVNPKDGYWYIIQKTTNGASKIYKVNGRGLATGSTATLIDTGVHFQKGSSKPFQETTSADMSPDGSTIIIRTYQAYYIYDSRNKTVETALSSAPCIGPAISEGQGEAVGFKPNNRGYVSISEGTNQKINNIDMR